MRKRIAGLGPVAKGIKLPSVRQKLGENLKVNFRAEEHCGGTMVCRAISAEGEGGVCATTAVSVQSPS